MRHDFPNFDEEGSQDNSPDDLLNQYYAGLLPDEDRHEAQRLIETSSEEVSFRDAFAQQLVKGGHGPTREEIDVGLSVLWSRISSLHPDEVKGAESTLTPVPNRKNRTEAFVAQFSRAGGLWIAVAASILAIGLWASPDILRQNQSASHATYSTLNGQRSSITLPDGSVVQLNVGSSIQVPSDYAFGNRTLKLDGEAKFTVEHNGSRPFVVQAGDERIEVLGTVFAVKRYQSDSLISVAVQSGKIKFANSVLIQDQNALVNVNTGKKQLVRINPSQFSFADGMLILKDVALTNAVADLNRWFDVDIRLGSESLKSRRITGEFSAGSVNDLIEVLGLTYNVRVENEGRTLTLYAMENLR